jgi:WD40 repeat protein
MQTMSSDAGLFAIIRDSERFLLRFFDMIESSATHIYESALPLSPLSSLVRALYGDQMPTDVKIGGIDDSWDALIRAIQLHDNAHCIAFSHKDDLIAVGEEWVVEIFEAATGQRRATLTNNSSVVSLTFSLDDSLLVTGCDDRSVNIWDLKTGGLVNTLKGHTNWVASVALSPCGTMIASSSGDHTARIWNISFLDCHCVLEGHSGHVNTVCWSATGREVISGSSDTTIKVWSVSSFECLKTFTMHTSPVHTIASSPYSPLIASGSRDGAINVFNANTGDILHNIPTHGGLVKSIRFKDQEQIMYTKPGSFVIRHLTKSSDVLSFEYEGLNAAISSDATRLASSQFDIVKIWQPNSTNHKQAMSDRHTARVGCISFFKDVLVATGSADRTAKVWDMSTGLCLTTFRGHLGEVHRIWFSYNSTLCASWGDDHIVRIWTVYAGDPISSINFGENHVYDVCFSPDDGQLASVTRAVQGSIWFKMWEVATGNCLAVMEVESNQFSNYADMSFDFDGTSVILRCRDTTQRWRLSSADPTPYRYEAPAIDDTNNLSMVLVPIHDAESVAPPPPPPPPPPENLPEFCYDPKSSCILDRQDRRILCTLPDWKVLGWDSVVYGTRVVFTSPTGRVIIVDFSDVEQVYSAIE